MRRALLLVLALVGCTDVFAPEAPGPFLKGDAMGLVFTAAVSRSPVTVGDTASLIFTLRNPTNRRVTLTFPSSCQITGRVRRGRHEVWPKPYACADVITAIVLEG